MTFRKLILWLHLWPGLISAAILFFVCLTGTMLVYSDEIMDLSAGDARYVKEVGQARIPAEQLIAGIKRAFPLRQSISYMVGYKDPQRSVRFNTFSKTEGLRMVYVDPYSGEILKDDATIYFFYITAHLHHSFLLGKTGQWIVDIATIVLILELITGLFLWLPKKWTKKSRDASFTVKWKANGKRLNYDLHKVLGFYALGISLLLAGTGAIIAFKPLSQAVNRALGGADSHEWMKGLPKADPEKKARNLHDLTAYAFEKYPKKKEIQVYTYNMDQTGFFLFKIADRVGLKSAQMPEFMIVDKYTGEEIPMPKAVRKHETVENMVWMLHMGNWMGALGKLITFLGGLIATSLPVTGFYIWWGKRRKVKANI